MEIRKLAGRCIDKKRAVLSLFFWFPSVRPFFFFSSSSSSLSLSLSSLDSKQADITQQAALAVSQQSVAYAVAILGENLYQRALLAEGAGGRPALPLTVAGAAAAAASAVLVGGSGGAGPGASLGLVVGAVGALGTLFVSVNRVKNVTSDPFVRSCFFRFFFFSSTLSRKLPQKLFLTFSLSLSFFSFAKPQ